MKEVKEKIRNVFGLIDVTKSQMKNYLRDAQKMDEADDVSLTLFYL